MKYKERNKGKIRQCDIRKHVCAVQRSGHTTPAHAAVYLLYKSTGTSQTTHVTWCFQSGLLRSKQKHVNKDSLTHHENPVLGVERQKGTRCVAFDTWALLREGTMKITLGCARFAEIFTFYTRTRKNWEFRSHRQ